MGRELALGKVERRKLLQGYSQSAGLGRFRLGADPGAQRVARQPPKRPSGPTPSSHPNAISAGTLYCFPASASQNPAPSGPEQAGRARARQKKQVNGCLVFKRITEVKGAASTSPHAGWELGRERLGSRRHWKIHLSLFFLPLSQDARLFRLCLGPRVVSLAASEKRSRLAYLFYIYIYKKKQKSKKQNIESSTPRRGQAGPGRGA
jgi:hypothetical protein